MLGEKMAAHYSTRRDPQRRVRARHRTPGVAQHRHIVLKFACQIYQRDLGPFPSVSGRLPSLFGPLNFILLSKGAIEALDQGKAALLSLASNQVWVSRPRWPRRKGLRDQRI